MQFTKWITAIKQKTSKGSLGARFASGIIWSFIGSIISQGLALLVSVIIARVLGKSGYGEFGIVNNTLITFGTFAGLGLGLTATKYVAEYRLSDPVKAGRVLGFSINVAIISGGLVSSLIFIFASPLASSTLNAPFLADELKLGSLLLFFNTFNGVQTGAFAGLEKFKIIAQLNLIRGLIGFPLMTVGVVFFKLPGAIAASVLIGFLLLVLYNKVLFNECKKAGIPISLKLSRQEFPILLHYSFPASLMGIIVGPTTWLANTMLVNQPGGYGELGILNAANQWRTVLFFLPTVFSNVALPMLASTQGLEDTQSNYDRVMDMTQSISIISIIPLASIIIFMGDWIMGLYGQDFVSGLPVLIGIVVGISISAIGNAAGTSIQAKGYMWLGFLLNLIWAFTYIFIVYLTIGNQKGVSLAIGFAAAHLILIVLGYLYLFHRKELSKKILLRTFFSVGYLFFIAFLALQLSSTMRLILALPITIYGFCLSLFFWIDTTLKKAIFTRLASLRISRWFIKYKTP